MSKDYWAGAVAACGGVEHLFSEKQYQAIAKRVYVLNEEGMKRYNNELAVQYGLPELQPGDEEIPLWTNKATSKT